MQESYLLITHAWRHIQGDGEEVEEQDKGSKERSNGEEMKQV